MALQHHNNKLVLTPAIHPPPPSSLTPRRGSLFNRILLSVVGKRNERAAGTTVQNPLLSSNITHMMSTLHHTSTSHHSTTQETGNSLQRKEERPPTWLPPSSSSSCQTTANKLAIMSIPCWQQQSPRGDHMLSGFPHGIELLPVNKTEKRLLPAPSGAYNRNPFPASQASEKPQRQGSRQNLKQAVLSLDKTGAMKCSKATHHEEHSKGSVPRLPGSDGGLQNALSSMEKVDIMGHEELECLEGLFSRVEEVAMSLLFSDGATQLRDKQVKKSSPIAPTEVEGVCLAFPVGSQAQKTPSLKYVFLPLNPANATVDNWCRAQLLRIMSQARVICYGGQELIVALISHFQLKDEAKIWLPWHPLDINVAAWLLDPEHSPESFNHLLPRFAMQPSVTNLPGMSICSDLALLGPLMVKVYQKLQAKDLWTLFFDFETKLIPILAAMGVHGIRVNCEKLLHYADLLKARISRVEASAHKAAGRKFSINSTAQLRQVLFDELHLDDKCSKKLSKTQVQRQKSTSEAVLVQLQDLHPLPGLVLEYRQLCKVKATYINGILPYISEDVLRPCWQHTGTATGRLVSCSPNIQAFPKQPINLGAVKEQYIVGREVEEVTIDIREAVESRPGFSFLAADFKSIELRLLAHLSEDPTLIGILKSQQTADVFTLLASQWLNMDLESVKGPEREKTKRVVYAVVYGVGKERLAEILKIHSSHAKELMNSFLGKFPGVQAFIQKTIADGKEKEYLTTICKRKRWFPHINSANPQLRSQSDRQAVNFPIQGSAADICKSAMLQVMQMLVRESPKSRLLLQIHDELLFEVPDEQVHEIAAKVKAVLESPDLLSCALKVPLEVRVTVGKTWATLGQL